LLELGDASLEPKTRPSQAQSTSRPASTAMPRPSGKSAAASGGAATQDLDYFVEMLAGTNDPKKVSAITKAASSSTAPRASQVVAAPPKPAVEQFINCEHELLGHTGFVFDTAVHIATSRLFTASADFTIMVWDLSTMRSVDVLRGHTNNVYSLLVDEPVSFRLLRVA
jgi:WD40 repeat protein